MPDEVTDMYKMGAVKCRPHVVILGAGASCAAIPNGDRNGRKISVMRGFLEALNLKHLLSVVEIRTDSDNIEDIYSELAERPECAGTAREIESAIVRVMSGFQIPSQPTVYDYLLLSLREKDLIATFNWDPLLVQAYVRAQEITDRLPDICFLHGNVALSHNKCEHGGTGLKGCFCPICHTPYSAVPLLYPVKNKDYVSDPWIRRQWEKVTQYMKIAGALTIFGYSAPKSDVEAISLLKAGWGEPRMKPIQQTEFIDLKGLGELEATWSDFIYHGHSSACDSFFKSKLALCPRRTVESDIERLCCNKFISCKNSRITDGMSFAQLRDHLEPLIQDEERVCA